MIINKKKSGISASSDGSRMYFSEVVIEVECCSHQRDNSLSHIECIIEEVEFRNCGAEAKSSHQKRLMHLRKARHNVRQRVFNCMQMAIL
jgi:hypothetical protein